jgi:hypothetical protein
MMKQLQRIEEVERAEAVWWRGLTRQEQIAVSYDINRGPSGQMTSAERIWRLTLGE